MALAVFFSPSLPGASVVQGEAGEPAVQMDPFRVLAGQFEIDAHISIRESVRYIDKMVVGAVTRNSLAAQAGLRQGMTIVSIYGVPVAGRPEQEFVREYVAHHDATRLTLVVSRFFGGLRTIEIVWPAAKLPASAK